MQTLLSAVRWLLTCYRLPAVVALMMLSMVSTTSSAQTALTTAVDLSITDAATSTKLDLILTGKQRSQTSRDRDIYQHPKATLEFFGLRETMTVMEIWPDKAGWWAEILAPLLKARGRYIAAQWDPKSEQPFYQDTSKGFQAKLAADPASYSKVHLVALQPPGALAPVPANSVDLVLSLRKLHNWLVTPDTARAMLSAIYLSLKPGGILGLEDNRATPSRSADSQLKLGYVDENAAIELVRSVGFEYLGSSEINANPSDTKDYDQGVWALPPTLRLGDKDRDRYLGIGESDRFTLRFRKPTGSTH